MTSGPSLIYGKRGSFNSKYAEFSSPQDVGGGRQFPGGYGLISAEKVLVVEGSNSKRRSHSLETLALLDLGGVKVQFLAAWRAASAKYLLGPGASK